MKRELRLIKYNLITLSVIAIFMGILTILDAQGLLPIGESTTKPADIIRGALMMTIPTLVVVLNRYFNILGDR